MVELLAPAGNWISLRAAIEAGADSIYFGLKELNMRAKANNFKLNEINKVTQECRKHKVKAYLTLNTIIYENELNKIKSILKKAKQAKIDAIICWDHAVIKEASKLKLPIHLSTQASVSNSEAAKFYKKLGVKRIILARELNLNQIKQIKKESKIEVEVFIHGAMCVSISGRCFLSHYLFNKSANRGECLQPCRRKFILKDIEENHELELGQDYIISPKDLCTIDIIDKLIKAKIGCFKIEGRMRSPEYVKTVTEVYREAIDAVLKDIKNE